MGANERFEVKRGPDGMPFRWKLRLIRLTDVAPGVCSAEFDGGPDLGRLEAKCRVEDVKGIEVVSLEPDFFFAHFDGTADEARQAFAAIAAFCRAAQHARGVDKGAAAQTYLHDLGYLVREQATEAKEAAKEADADAFACGVAFAYHQVVSLMQQQAEAFEIPLEGISMKGLDPDRDLL